ncbi:MAG: hypothetical protein CG446_1167, partial [Methanosaeta sp. ASO1]
MAPNLELAWCPRPYFVFLASMEPRIIRIDETVSGRCREMELGERKRPGYNSTKLPNIQEIVTSDEAAEL